MKKIILHGDLADHIPNGEFECEFSTASEAVSAIECNWPGFHNKIRNKSVYVIAGDPDSGKSFDEDMAVKYRIGADTLHIIPAIEGAGGGNRGIKAILGVALIAVSFGFGGIVTGGLASAATIGGTSLGVTGFSLLTMGAGMVLQALIQPPKPPKSSEREVSSFYGGPLNTQAEGGIVPYVAGQSVIAGGVVIHSDLIIEQVL